MMWVASKMEKCRTHVAYKTRIVYYICVLICMLLNINVYMLIYIYIFIYITLSTHNLIRTIYIAHTLPSYWYCFISMDIYYCVDYRGTYLMFKYLTA